MYFLLTVLVQKLGLCEKNPTNEKDHLFFGLYN